MTHNNPLDQLALYSTIAPFNSLTFNSSTSPFLFKLFNFELFDLFPLLWSDAAWPIPQN